MIVRGPEVGIVRGPGVEIVRGPGVDPETDTADEREMNMIGMTAGEIDTMTDMTGQEIGIGHGLKRGKGQDHVKDVLDRETGSDDDNGSYKLIIP